MAIMTKLYMTKPSKIFEINNVCVYVCVLKSWTMMKNKTLQSLII